MWAGLPEGEGSSVTRSSPERVEEEGKRLPTCTKWFQMVLTVREAAMEL